MSVIFVHSHYGPIPPVFAGFAEEGRVKILRDSQLGNHEVSTARGIVTTMHLDQIAFAERRDALAAFFRNGGRLFFNGHVLKPFADGLQVYRPLTSRRLNDFQLQRLAPHPVFGGLDQKDMAIRKGVAGFYGRGHNPMPQGAVALTGLGGESRPVDWEWRLPGGGVMFSHAGNDLWSMAPENSDGPKAFAERIVDWTAGELEGAAA